jgi:hypothetical protein
VTEITFDEQIPFGTDSFADNPEPRCPCILLLDTSASMQGAPITALNAGLQVFKEELTSDTLAMKRIEVALLSFGPVTLVNDFHTAPSFVSPTLNAQGDTPMGAAIIQALDKVRLRKEEYRSNGIAFYRPWIFLITDGAPTDDWQAAANAIREGEASKAFAFFAVGVENANMSILKQLAAREPLKLEGLKFRELFQWLSNSMKSVSRSVPGTAVPLDSPQGWAEL